jgi:GDP-L-fucose synthase
MLKKNDVVFVAGHNGMVGSAVIDSLVRKGFDNLLVQDRSKLDLTNQSSVLKYLSSRKIDHVVIAAAKVGGISANNSMPAEFIYENLMIEANLIHGAHLGGINSLLFLGSSCIYPRDADQPIKEDYLLTGALEATNEPYAIAKIAGIKLCESYNRQYGRDYRSLMPTNLYGPGDNFHPENSHVVPALIRRFAEAKESNLKEVVIWGTGSPLREFLHISDLAEACVHVLNMASSEYQRVTTPMMSHLNVGSGEEISIKELAKLISNIVGYQGRLSWDSSKLDGTPRKLMDSSIIKNLGWKPEIFLRAGLSDTYSWFIKNRLDYRI